MPYSTNRMLLVARIAFGTWIAIEALSWAKVLPLTLEFTWLGLIITATAAWGALELISWWLRKNGATSLWGWTFLAALVSQCTDACGDIFRLYGRYNFYDQIAHVVGGAVLALVLLNVLYALEKAGRIQLLPSIVPILSVLGAMAIGSLYELEEYGEDVLFGSNRLGSAFDTGNDMLMNTLGALVMVIIIWQSIRRKNQT